MTAETITATTPSAAIHPGWVRVRHWITAIAILVMIRSGRQIYDASPQFAFTFPRALLRAYGFPIKIRTPTKLGFKQPKYVVAMEVTSTDHGGYWEDQGYNWFGGL